MTVPASYSTQWATDLLGLLGAPPTQENYKLLAAWATEEGGGGKFNPFNTTLATPGSTNAVFAKGNPAGVKDYPSYDAGLVATYQTLMLPAYAGVVKSLKQGTSAAMTAAAIGNSPWASGPPYGQAIANIAGEGNLLAGIKATTGTDGGVNAASPDVASTACYWNWKSPSLGPLGGSTYCLDPILWLSVGLLGVSTLLVGGALMAIGAGRGGTAAKQIVSTLGPAKVAKVARGAGSRVAAAGKSKTPAKPKTNVSTAGAEVSKSASTLTDDTKGTDRHLKAVS